MKGFQLSEIVSYPRVDLWDSSEKMNIFNVLIFTLQTSVFVNLSNIEQKIFELMFHVKILHAIIVPKIFKKQKLVQIQPLINGNRSLNCPKLKYGYSPMPKLFYWNSYSLIYFLSDIWIRKILNPISNVINNLMLSLLS